MTDPTPEKTPDDLDREALHGVGKELWAITLAFASVGLILFLAVMFYRVLIPMVIEAGFFGSVYAGALLGFLGTLGLGVLACFLYSRIARLFSK